MTSRLFLAALAALFSCSSTVGQDTPAPSLDSVVVDSIVIEGSLYKRNRFPQNEADLVLVYFPNGQVYREYYLKNHDFDRHYKEWDESGRLRVLTPYRDGKPHGRWEEWNANGTRVFEADLENGAGTMITYYNDGLAPKQIAIVDPDGLYVEPPKCFMPDGASCECPKLETP